MEKKEFKVGEVFQCGLIKLKVKEGKNYSCNECYFYHDDSLSCGGEIEKLIGKCTSMERSDRTNVMFVKVED